MPNRGLCGSLDMRRFGWGAVATDGEVGVRNGLDVGFGLEWVGFGLKWVGSNLGICCVDGGGALMMIGMLWFCVGNVEKKMVFWV